MRLAIHVEGGGETRNLQAALRRGFDGLLELQKNRARNKGIGWKLLCAGGRDQAWEAFRHALEESPADCNILLVDAEEPLHLHPVTGNEVQDAANRARHLHRRDGWLITGIDHRCMHLMVRCMEAWIAADPDALARYYKQGFNHTLLPARVNLEDEPKVSLFAALAAATRQSKTRGEYTKRRHASEILPLLSHTMVSARCPHFSIFTAWLDQVISAS